MNIFISLFILDCRECEEKFLFPLSISESLKLKFSFILGTPGSYNNDVFGWKKVIFRLQVQFFLEISISILEKYELLISLSPLETRNKNFKFLFLLSNLK